jgi:hypothetical protein
MCSDPTGLGGFHRLIGESPADRSRLRALWDETEDALTTPPAQPGGGVRERAARRLEAARLTAGLHRRRGGTPAAAGWIRERPAACPTGLKAAGR